MIKKLIFFMLTSIVAITTLFVSIDTNNIAYADNENATEEEIGENIDELLNSLSFEEYQQFLDSLEELNFETDLKTLIKQVLNNEFQFDFNYFLSYITQILFGNIKGMAIKILLILIVVILINLLKSLTSGFAKKSTEKIVSLLGTGIVIGLITSFIIPVIKETASLINNVNGFASVIFPILITCMSFIGASAEVAIYQPLMLIFAEAIIKITEFIILPMFYVSFIFGIIGNLSDDLKFGKVSDFALSVGKIIPGVVFGLFITYTTAQGITGASIDSLAVKGTKYALQTYVPVIGNYLKDGFDIITAGFIIIKNSFGFVSIIIILLYVLIPILKIICSLLALKLTSAICEPFGEKKLTCMFSTVGNSMKIPLMICICLAFVLIVFIMLIILTCNRGIV